MDCKGIWTLVINTLPQQWKHHLNHQAHLPICSTCKAAGLTLLCLSKEDHDYHRQPQKFSHISIVLWRGSVLGSPKSIRCNYPVISSLINLICFYFWQVSNGVLQNLWRENFTHKILFMSVGLTCLENKMYRDVRCVTYLLYVVNHQHRCGKMCMNSTESNVQEKGQKFE